MSAWRPPTFALLAFFSNYPTPSATMTKTRHYLKYTPWLRKSKCGDYGLLLAGRSLPVHTRPHRLIARRGDHPPPAVGGLRVVVLNYPRFNAS